MKNKKYIQTTKGIFSNLMHRVVYRYFYQINIEDYNKNYNEIDHINTICNHNCICNLRICSMLDNNRNPKTCENRSKACKGIKKSEKHKNTLSVISNNRPKNYKCFFCNSIKMNINNYTQWHGNGKCLFK